MSSWAVWVRVTAQCIAGAAAVALAVAVVAEARAIYEARRARRALPPPPPAAPLPSPAPPAPAAPRHLPLTILFTSTTGTARSFAARLQREAFALRAAGFFVAPRLVDLAGYNVESLEEERGVLVLLLPTWTGGVPPSGGAPLHAHLRELALDFRVGRGALRALSVATFGLGSREYGGDWCRAAAECHEWMVALGARELLPAAKGDESSDMIAAFGDWLGSALLPAVCEAYAEAYV